MRKRTTIKQLQNALSNNLLIIESAESYNKTSRKTEEITSDTFKDSLDFLCETVFSPCIGWYFEKNHKIGNYEVDCSRMDGNSNIVIIAHLCVNSGINAEDIDKVLLFQEE